MAGYIDERTGQVVGPTGQPVFTNTVAPIAPSTGSVNPAYTAPGTSGGDGFAGGTGWAGKQGYTPEMLESIYQNPWFLLQDVFKGIETSSPGYAAMRDFGADPLSLFSMMEGAGRLTANDKGGAANTFANFLQNLYSQLGTPGGKALSSGELLNNIFGQGEFGADSKTDLGALLGQGDASTQIRTLFNLLRDVAGAGMNPLAASAYMGSVQQAGDEYGNQMLRTGAGSTQNPVEFMREKYPWLTGQAPR